MRALSEIRGLCLLQGALYAASCIAFSYIGVFFRQNGFDERMIGNWVAAGGLCTLAVQPLLGRLSDRVSGPCRLIQLLAGIALVCALGMYAMRASAVAIGLLFILVSVSEKSLVPLLDSVVTARAQNDPAVRYGTTRAAGSLGAGLCMALVGFLLQHGFLATYALHALFLGVMILLLNTARRQDVRAVSRVRLRAGYGAVFFGLMAVGFLLYLGIGVEVTFYSVLFLDIGGTGAALGISLLIMSLSEWLVMANIHRVQKRIRLRWIMSIALLCYAAKLLLSAAAPAWYMLLALQAMQGATFGLFYPVFVTAVVASGPRETLTGRLALGAALTSGAGSIAGVMIAGYIGVGMGTRAMFVFGGLCALCALACWWALPTLRSACHGAAANGCKRPRPG